MKIVINRCFGGYSLSEEAYKFLGLTWDECGYAFDEDRTNPRLIECVEMLGEKANGRSAELKVVEIPDDVSWYLDGHDGQEAIRETHRTWIE